MSKKRSKMALISLETCTVSRIGKNIYKIPLHFKFIMFLVQAWILAKLNDPEDNSIHQT